MACRSAPKFVVKVGRDPLASLLDGAVLSYAIYQNDDDDPKREQDGQPGESG